MPPMHVMSCHVVFKELPHVNEVVPIKWLRYENVLRVLKEKDHKFISLSTAKKNRFQIL